MLKREEQKSWKRGKILGRGSFGTVYLATTHHPNLPSLMAVKSGECCFSLSLAKEKRILFQLKVSPYIIGCYGDDFTHENGYPFYNLFLEYASGGSLADRIKKYNGSKGLPESLVRFYTHSILQGLKTIHQHGYAHCDIKPENILIVSSSSNSRNPEIESVKIADFGLAKRIGEQNNTGRHRLRGTPLYMAPESVTRNEYEPHCDVWALGCVIVEMLTGQTAWNCSPGTDLSTLLSRIGFSSELPCMPEGLSKEGRDFLNKCFIRDTSLRWTPNMLLQHPFVAIGDGITIGLVLSPTTFSHDLPQFQSLVPTCLAFKKRGRIDNEVEEMKTRLNISDKRSITAAAKQFSGSIHLGGKRRRIMGNEVQDVKKRSSVGSTSTTANVAHGFLQYLCRKRFAAAKQSIDAVQEVEDVIEVPSVSTSTMNDGDEPLSVQQYRFRSVDAIQF